MDTLTTVFLAVIALGSLLQAGFVLGLFIAARRAAGKLDDLEQRLLAQVRPATEKVNALASRLTEVSEMVLRQGERIDAAVGRATDTLDSAVGRAADTLDTTVARAAVTVDTGASVLSRAATRASEPLNTLAALWKGLRRGIDVYRGLEPLPSRVPYAGERVATGPAHVEPPAANIGRPVESIPRRQAEI